eukprot:1136177-Pelagomonas_calceolata.AAC.1
MLRCFIIFKPDKGVLSCTQKSVLKSKPAMQTQHYTMACSPTCRITSAGKQRTYADSPWEACRGAFVEKHSAKEVLDPSSVQCMHATQKG